MTLFSTLFPLLCFFAYNVGVTWLERLRPSLSTIMDLQRRRWVANAARRESPFDAILSGNLMGSVSFLASTAVLLVLAVFAAFGQIGTLMESLKTLSVERIYTVGDIQVHLVAMLAMFVLAFFAFTLSLRQFNHFCIMLGAMEHGTNIAEDEIIAIAQVNSLAAQNFNAGVRAYYFSVSTVAWFAAEWMSIAAALVTVLILLHREFFSSAHRTAATIALQAERRHQPNDAKSAI